MTPDTPSPQERRADYKTLIALETHVKTLVEETPKIREDIATLRVEVSALKVKAGWTGAITGALMSLPIYVKYFFLKGGQ